MQAQGTPLSLAVPQARHYLEDYIVVGYGDESRLRQRAQQLNKHRRYQYSVRQLKPVKEVE